MTAIVVSRDETRVQPKPLILTATVVWYCNIIARVVLRTIHFLRHVSIKLDVQVVAGAFAYKPLCVVVYHVLRWHGCTLYKTQNC